MENEGHDTYSWQIRLIVGGERRAPSPTISLSPKNSVALVTVRPILDRVPHLKGLLRVDTQEDFSDLRRAEATGRPLGAPGFVAGLEELLGRKIARRAPGRRPTGEVVVSDQLELL